MMIVRENAGYLLGHMGILDESEIVREQISQIGNDLVIDMFIQSIMQK